MMPNDDDLTANMFCAAADWIKHQDPESADRFYKGLVLGCGRTELGKQADRLRWFPKANISGDELQRELQEWAKRKSK